MLTPRGAASGAVVVTWSVHQAAAGQPEKDVLQRRPTDQRALGDMTHPRDFLKGGVAVLRIEKDPVGQHLLAFGQSRQRRCDLLVLAWCKPKLDDLFRRELLDQLSRRPLGRKAAFVHHDQSVAELLRLVHVMGGDDEGDPFLLEAVETVPQQVPGLRIETRRGLVQDEEIRVGDQGTGDRQSALHPS